ncbi:MAG: hypothetical protein Q4G03_03870 [Planctomycetia bacterium]|nr:hypothetical protein [Planctomycetia bacterium]
MNSERYDWKFHIAGIPIVVKPTFWLLCVMFSPFLSNNTAAGQPWLFGFIGWALALLTTFLIHELGHALAIRWLYKGSPRIVLGIGMAEPTVFVFGGVTYETYNHSTFRTILGTPLKNATVTLAGPFLALFVAGLGLVLAGATGSALRYGTALYLPYCFPFNWVQGITSVHPLSLMFGYFFYGFFYSATLWSFLNLLPIFPLDGGRVILALTSGNGVEKGLLYTLPISMAFSAIMAIMLLSSQSIFGAIFMAWITISNFRTWRALSRRS